MATFTCITNIRDSIHITQHDTDSPDAALREHIAALPHDDGSGPFDGELDWLHSFSGGSADLALLPVTGCVNSWLWADGARYEPQYLTYLVQTDTQT